MKKIFFLQMVLSLSFYLPKAQNCNNWLYTPSNPSYATMGQINITGSTITVEATINRTTPYTGGILYAGDVVSKHNTPADVNYLLRPNNAEITTSNGYFRTPDICEIELNKTYHIALVYDGVTLKFYRNGFLMSQVAATGTLFQNTWQTRIGWYEPQGFNTNFIGYTNEVRIWNVAKTQSELRTYMNSSLPNPTSQPGLVAYYTFDNLTNKQGNAAYNGVLGGAASINQTNPNCNFVADSCATIVNNNGISGIINDYTPVISINPCDNKLTVEDATKYNVGDTIMIIQMKGAVIDSTNTTAFGTVTNYNNAGNYEFNYIKNKAGNIIELKNGLTRQYDMATGKVQLIRVPYYNSVDITSTLTCLPWDGSKGGVLVLNVRDSINLNADIDVSGKGFKGGNSPNTGVTKLFCFTNDFTSIVGDLAAAAKGESIVTIGNDKAWGKGAPASGGGGGLGHNSGGGGGANAGTGGFGGYQLLTCGNAPFDNRGIGGYPLTYNNTQNKIFMGGGGGSGHVDNAGGSNMEGGNGGGIAIIISQVLKSNDFKIIAKGGNATQCNFVDFKDCHDGSGGGGGGGVVLMETNKYLNPTEINVNGGKGADLVIYNPSAGADKIGPGGGGGAGIAWFNSVALPINATVIKTGGINGGIIQNNNDAWGSTAGKEGMFLFDLKIPVDTILFKNNIDSVKIKDSATYCNTFDFKGLAFTSSASISNWEWNFGDGNTASTQNTFHSYNLTGKYSVKLIVTDINGCKDSIISPINTGFGVADAGLDTSVCSNTSISVRLKGTGGNKYSWTPAIYLNDSALQNPVATINTTTKFYVTVTNPGCSGMTDSVTINVNSAPIVIANNDTAVCGRIAIQLHVTGAANYTWLPSTGLSNPGIANPIATPATTTQYIVTGANTNGCTASDTVNIFIKPSPTITKSTDSTVCRNIPVQLFASGGASYSWAPAASLNNPSIANPLASPTINTTYLVTVTGTNSCSKTDSVKIAIRPLPTFTISPNKAACINNSNVILSAGGGSSYLWSPAALVSNPNSSSPVSNANSTTTFTVKIKDNTCNDSALLTTTVIISPPPTVKAFKLNDIDCVFSSAQLTASGAGKYVWSPATGLNDSNISNPLASITTPQQYLVTGTDTITQCTGTATITVFIKPPFNPAFFVPNAFSPNGDGRNDCFRVKHFGTVKSVDISIYNRLGNLIFHTTNVTDCWDGTYKGNPAEPGNYVYYIKTFNECGTNTRKGNLILMR